MIVDGHLDLAFSALNFGRNLSLPLDEIRQYDSKAARRQGVATVSIESLLVADVAVVLGSLYATPKSRQTIFTTNNEDLVYEDDTAAPLRYRQDQAHAAAMRQYDFYRRLQDDDQRVVLINSAEDLDTVLTGRDGPDPKLGIVLHMEGAEPIRDPSEIEMWYEIGLRSIGPAWDDTRYAPGQWNEAGRLPKDGFALLERMLDYRMICDITHMSEAAAWETLELYDGAICASHSNVRSFVDTPRQLSNRQIEAIADRRGVIGITLYNPSLRKDQTKGYSRERVGIEHVVAHIDHICQLTGSAEHVGIGSDMDGGYGLVDLPTGIDSSADLPKIATALHERGYDADHIDAIMYGNWLRLLRLSLP